MSDNMKLITKDTLIPIGLACSLLVGVFYLGALSAQIKQNTTDIAEINRVLQNVPSQYQFTTLQEDLKDLKEEIKGLRASIETLNSFNKK